ncbi:MAG: hypothetical protein II921_00465 [Treponema sp.]|nr:hypothetical protein [Treponema sp.]
MMFLLVNSLAGFSFPLVLRQHSFADLSFNGKRIGGYNEINLLDFSVMPVESMAGAILACCVWL